MSFRFNWPEFDPIFYTEAKSQLETALNKEKKSKHIAGHIFVNELNMGSKPPELEILEICELSTDYFRGIFKLSYCGDSSIALQTKIQANPLYTPPTYKPLHYPLPRHSRPDIVAAAQPLVIPMLLRISDVRLNGIIMLSVSKSKGITLVFKNDPLESLLVSSTFDIVASVKSFLQQQIESQLRTFLQDTFPLVVHEFSLRHITTDRQQQNIRINQSVPPFKQQQQYGSDIYDHDFTSFISNTDKNHSDILSVPDLTSSSSSSVSECFSDTSSEHFSYSLYENDNDDSLIYGSTCEEYATTHQQYTTNSMFTSSLYDSDSEQTQSSISPSLSSHSSHFFLQTAHHDGTAEKDHYYHEPSSSSTTTSQPSIQFHHPITLSSTTHGLLQRMHHLSASSQTIAIGSKDTICSSVHKPGMIMMKSNEPLWARRKKIPKRRIIRWNP